MSALNNIEPHKFSAGALALVVHIAFFSVLFLSFNWHVKRPPAMEVEMWDKLPDTAPEIIPPPPEPLPPVAPPAPVIPKAEAAPKMIKAAAPEKAEIEFKDKNKKKPLPVKKEEPVAKAPAKPDESEKLRALAAQAALTKQQELAQQQALAKQQELAAAQQKLEKQRETEARVAREEQRIQEHRAKMRADADQETATEVARYKELIQAKISRNIVMPPDVPDNAEAIFLVIVLPGGAVMDGVKLVKPSGNAAYDAAAERAIYKAQPLPMPQNAELARMFRELRLSVKP